MKMTIELPDDLVRRMKIRAAEENRRLKDMVAELLARGLEEPPSARPPAPRRVRLPLVRTERTQRPAEELTSERIADILLGSDVSASR